MFIPFNPFTVEQLLPCQGLRLFGQWRTR